MSDKCTARIYVAGFGRSRTCTRNATKDGYCAQHHPDAIAARRAERGAKWEREREALREAAEAPGKRIRYLESLLQEVLETKEYDAWWQLHCRIRAALKGETR